MFIAHLKDPLLTDSVPLECCRLEVANNAIGASNFKLADYTRFTPAKESFSSTFLLQSTANANVAESGGCVDPTRETP
jgi:hypothetical protein